MEDDNRVKHEERPDILRPAKAKGELDPLMSALQISIRKRLDDVLFDDWGLGEEEIEFRRPAE